MSCLLNSQRFSVQRELTIKLGDFTKLAENYSANRPDYSETVLRGLLGIIDLPKGEIRHVDVGAGTGIWTNMVNKIGVESSIAIEPNDSMRDFGIKDNKDNSIQWLPGSAESTGIESSSCNWVTMASSFHWADFDKSTKEFHRILEPGGLFTALWNPRVIEANPLFLEIEQQLLILKPDLKRVSSGNSGITETLTKSLSSSPYFEDVTYIEASHVISMSPARYLGAWRSVNDLQVQLGVDKFEEFIAFVEQKLEQIDFVESTYLTRSWSARRSSY